MERASLFLRGFEAAFGRSTASVAGSLPSLLWERWRGDPDRAGTPWVAKAAPSIVASIALYGLFAAAGVTLLIVAAADHRLPLVDRHLAIVMACAAGALYASVAAYICVQALSILHYSHKPANFTAFRSRSAVESPTSRPKPRPGSPAEEGPTEVTAGHR